MVNVDIHSGFRHFAPVLALLLAAGLASPAPAEDPQLDLGTSGTTRTIQMHAPVFRIDDPRDKKDPTDEGGLGGIFSGNPDLGSPSSYETDTVIPQMPAYLPLLGQMEKSRKQRNWILPPTPEGLFGESDAGEEDALEGGDLRSSAKAIYERAYMGQGRDEAYSDAEGRQEDAAARDRSGEARNTDSAMGLLLPESGGLSLGPTVGLLGADFGAQVASRSLEPAALEAAAFDGLLFAADAALPDAGLDEDDPAFDPEALALRSMAASGEDAGSFEFGAGFSARDPFSRVAFGGEANSGTRGAFDLSPTSTRTDGLGDWRTMLSSTASAMQPMQERSSSAVDASAWSGVSQVGRETGRAFEGLSDRFSSPAGGRLTTATPGSLFGGRFGALPGTASGSIAGSGSSIGGFGMRDNLSTGRSSLSTPSLGSRSIGSGMRSGVRTVDEMPNPLGGSLFD